MISIIVFFVLINQRLQKSLSTVPAPPGVGRTPGRRWADAGPVPALRFPLASLSETRESLQ